jgi:GcrA cell cycle regulator
MSWNDERVELLSKLWLEGRSASQIAAELGLGVTRNAVIGKVHRLGLSGRVKMPVPQAAGRLRTRIASKLEDTAPLAPIEPALKAAEAATGTPVRPSADVVIPFSTRVTIMDLRDTMCRWPLGDPTSVDFRYCGSRSGPLGPYCEEHAQLAFQPTQERRRADRMVRIA